MNELVRVIDGKIDVNRDALTFLKEFYKSKARADIMEKEIRAGLLNAMEEVGLKKFMTDGISAIVKEPYTKTTVDSKKLKTEYPDIYEECSKVSQVSSSITLSFEE